MLWTLFYVLLVLWVLGLATQYTMGGFIHVLLVVAILVLFFLAFRGPGDSKGGGSSLGLF